MQALMGCGRTEAAHQRRRRRPLHLHLKSAPAAVQPRRKPVTRTRRIRPAGPIRPPWLVELLALAVKPSLVAAAVAMGRRAVRAQAALAPVTAMQGLWCIAEVLCSALCRSMQVAWTRGSSAWGCDLVGWCTCPLSCDHCEHPPAPTTVHAADASLLWRSAHQAGFRGGEACAFDKTAKQHALCTRK